LTNQKMGYTEELYRGFLESESGVSFHDIFDDLVHGTASFIPYLDSALAFDGRKLSSSESKTETSRYGLKGVNKGDGYDVKLVLQNSSASDSGVVAGDLVIGVNGILLAKDLDKWLNYFKGEPIKLLINRSGKQVRRELTVPNDNQYYDWVIEEL
jgi:predicted metalloprotease with PDZ domain